MVEPSIAAVAGQKRRDRIKEWEREHLEEGIRYRAARRRVKSTFLFASGSQKYPNCALGLKEPGVNSLQTDMLFAELFDALAAPIGRVGCIIPTAIATSASGQHLFRAFTVRGGVVSLYDFENGKPIFPGVHASYKFCLLSLTGKKLREPAARYSFFLTDTPELDDVERVFALTPEELALINPNTSTLPTFRSRRDAALTVAIYDRVPVLLDETKRHGNLWMITFKNLVNSTDDSDLFLTRDRLMADGWQLVGNVFTRSGQHMLPVFEGKMAHLFDVTGQVSEPLLTDQAATGIQGSPLASMTRASKKLRPCLAAVDR